jgi:hypothetical protein
MGPMLKVTCKSGIRKVALLKHCSNVIVACSFKRKLFRNKVYWQLFFLGNEGVIKLLRKHKMPCMYIPAEE